MKQWKLFTPAEIREGDPNFSAFVVDIHALDDGSEQPAAVLRGEHVPDCVEVAEALGDPTGLGLRSI
jgi:hypothetical protein